jgi:hypothetical protein
MLDELKICSKLQNVDEEPKNHFLAFAKLPQASSRKVR